MQAMIQQWMRGLGLSIPPSAVDASGMFRATGNIGTGTSAAADTVETLEDSKQYQHAVNTSARLDSVGFASFFWMNPDLPS